jgi:hypothetical protein
MKLSDLRKLIIESVNEEVLEEVKPVDEVGSFYVVEKPKKGSTKAGIVKEMTVFDNIDPKSVLGVYAKRPAANQKASEAIKEMEASIKDLEASMNEFRDAKKGINEKKKRAADIIKKLR